MPTVMKVMERGKTRNRSTSLEIRSWISHPSGVAIALVASSALLIGAALPAPPDSTPPRASAAAPPPAVSFPGTLLAGVVRLLVEVTLEHVDLEGLKEKAIEKLGAKEEAEYQRQINEIFDDLESVNVHEFLGITRKSSREDVMAALKRIDKATLVGAMRGIPDASIANLIERELREKGVSSLGEIHEYLETRIEEFVTTFSAE